MVVPSEATYIFVVAMFILKLGHDKFKVGYIFFFQLYVLHVPVVHLPIFVSAMMFILKDTASSKIDKFFFLLQFLDFMHMQLSWRWMPMRGNLWTPKQTRPTLS